MNNISSIPDRTSKTDVICLSHLRWNFVYQRPQHLMSRFARAGGRVFFIEEPIEGPDTLQVTEEADNVLVCVPELSGAREPDQIVPQLISSLVRDHSTENYIAWFYTPMMLNWISELSPRAVVYDCMDELSAFRGAPPELTRRESELFARADLVFTGGQSLYEAKQSQHTSVHAFPSSIDVSHFGRARELPDDRPEQASVDRPRVGYAGVIDERLDLELLADVAELRPDLHFIMVGPVVKIDESTLPRPANIHYLGQKSYDELPALMAGWDVGMMPFALNESTRYISPTKTPEYLAAGLPVVSTAITDVVRPYGDLGLVHIAATAHEFAEAIDAAILEDPARRHSAAAEFLQKTSWDATYTAMRRLIDQAMTNTSATVAAEAAR